MQRSGKAQTSSKNQKPVDYVLVVKEENLHQIEDYIDNLHILGFETENEKGKTVDLIFIKVFISEEGLRHFSDMYDIGNEEVRKLTVLFVEPIFPNPFPTPISRILPKVQGEITDAEKIMIVNTVLENTRFSENSKDYGISKLIELKILETAYPLHDGPISEQADDNVRSLLFCHWANIGVTHKQQPLDLVYRYFGTEIAFYFAWIEYFSRMLIVPAILGTVTFLASASSVLLGESEETDEVCQNHHAYICPTCVGYENCQVEKISSFCALAHWSFIFDSEFTVAFAVFMSFWAILFLNLWRRKESKLKMRWNITLEEHETDIRRAYTDSAKYYKHNKFTGQVEPYTPTIRQAFKFAVSFLICASLIAIIILGVLFVASVRVFLSIAINTSNLDLLQPYSRILVMCLGSILQVILIKIFSKLYAPISVKLTNFENPRTQADYDKSVLYKTYLLSFMNNYIPLFYEAFFKGVIYSVPHYKVFISRDVCQPLNCINNLCLQLVFMMTMEDLIANASNFIYLSIIQFNRYLSKDRQTRVGLTGNEDDIPQWETEYFLQPTDRYFITNALTEMIIKYGFVTFFVAAFPLAPVLALVNNLIQLRNDAYRMVKLYRRQVPRSRSGIGGPWNGVILSVTYLSTFTNAFTIAFTSDWVPKQVHRLSHGVLFDFSGYFNSTLSRFNTAHYDKYKTLKKFVPYCYYRGHRTPSTHKHQYEFTEAHWMNLTFKCIAILLFEHFILVCNAVLTYFIPDLPSSVKQQLDMDQQELRSTRLNKFERQFKRDGKLGKNISVPRKYERATNKRNLTLEKLNPAKFEQWEDIRKYI